MMAKRITAKMGSEYWVDPAFAAGSHGVSTNRQKGTVVWVHPKGHYAVLQFEGVHGAPRECFPPGELKCPA